MDKGYFALIIAGIISGILFIVKNSEAKSAILTGAPPETREDIIAYIREFAISKKLDPNMIQAVCEQESNYDPNAINPSDPSYGLMQLTINTGKFYNPKIKSPVDLYDIEKNLEAGCNFYLDMQRKYPSTSWYERFEIYNLGETKFFKKNLRSPAYGDGVTKRWNRIKNEN